MTLDIFYKLLAIVATIGVGWLALKRGLLAKRAPGSDPAQVLGNAALYLFIPALLFRTMVRLDLSALPWAILAAYFLPALLYLFAVYALYRATFKTPDARAATRTVAAIYGNAVQLGIPLVTALYGERGLALHLALVSVHGVLLLTVLTVLVESDMARGRTGTKLITRIAGTIRSAAIHPVVLPVLLGLGWNLSGLGLHPVLDQSLQTLGAAAVPVALVLIGATLATYGLHGRLRDALHVSALKLLVMPATVFLVAHFAFGLSGMPLAVLVMMAALPTGTNALIFAQRYSVLQAEASVAMVVSSFAFMGTAALWLAVLAWVG